MDAVLIYNGLPIKLITNNYTIIPVNFNSTGYLLTFNIGDVKYELFYRSNFNKSDEKNKYCIAGYYDSEAFTSYKNGLVEIDVLNRDYFFKYEEFKRAEIGDIVEVERLNPFPFNQYYNELKYTFKISSLSPELFTSINDLPKVETDENSEFYSVLVNKHNEFESKFTGLFYTKNLGSQINNWNSTLFPDENSFDNQIVENLVLEGKISKKSYARLMTFICWQIYHIYNRILDKISIEPLIFIEESYKNHLDNNPDTSDYWWNSLSTVDKIIAEMCQQWGVLKFRYGNEITDFPNIFDSLNPDYAKLLSYYNSLINFYEALRFKDESILFPELVDGEQVTTEEDSNRRIQYLSEISPLALGALPFDARIKLLEKYTILSKIEEEDQRFLIRIINSFNNELDANNFLDYLLKVRNGVSTNFEVIYRKLDDARIERYAIINWFVEHQTNRKYYIYLLYEMWKKSSYNFYHIPIGVIPNESGLNPNAYFLTNEGEKYYAQYNEEGELIKSNDPILQFLSYTSGGNWKKQHKVYYQPARELKKELITIIEVKVTSSSWPDDKKYGEYHIYQPIILMGYEADLELSVPQFAPIPAFLFYYAVEFDRIKDFDSGLNFTLEVGIEVALFFALGGTGALRHLKHLKHLGKLGRAYRGVLEVDEAVLVWRGLESGSEVLSVSAGVLSSTCQFIATTTNSSSTYQLAQKTGLFFLTLTFISIGGSVYGRRKAIKCADDIIREVDNLTTLGIPNPLDTEVYNVILTIGNKTSVRATQIINSLVSDYPLLANKLLDIKNSGNIKLSLELGEILYNKETKTLLKFNDNINFVNQFDELSKVKSFKNIVEFYEDFYRITDLQNSRKRFDVFSEFVGSVNSNGYLHEIDDVYEMLNYGISKNLSIDDITGLIIKSFRTQKQVGNISNIKVWMDNFTNFISHGIPFPFNNVNHFNSFKTEVGNLFVRYNLGNKITVGGSSLTKLIPPDLDLVLYLTPNKYDELIRHYEKVFKEANEYFKTKGIVTYNREIESINKALIASKNGDKIDVRCMIDFKIINGKPQLTRFMSDLKQSSFMNNLNVSNSSKNSIDFNIYRSSQGNRALSLPPEFNINL